MTRFVVGDDRGQSTLFPERLDDYLGEDNPVRAIDVLVDELGRHHGRPTAVDHVEHWHRIRDHAAHRRADDRRHDLVYAADAGRDPSNLWLGKGFRATGGGGPST